MTDEQLRALVRDSVARHLGREAAPVSAAPLRLHPSHYRYALASGGDQAGPCLIEPTVTCNHCGYCQSHGH